ncbi:hypothetical protein [Lysobacter sp. F6437]|uniref:hypothetical protein n=1 Tax=Lysobacter sp. F6437 TaxID=3459296 RepID=UPI00403DC23D
MTVQRLALALSLALLTTAPVALASDDHSKVNGSIDIAAAEVAGDVDTVNGSIGIGAGARIEDAETVNGGIEVGNDVHASSLSTVNGGIQVGTGLQLEGDIESVNGGIFVDRGSKIGGGIETVNGSIGLVGTEVIGDIETVTADLTVGADSHVHGGIHYEKPQQSWISFRKRDPRVIIGPNARVDGALVFEREVELYVHESAKIGPVTGATAVPYEGDRAPNGN